MTYFFVAYLSGALVVAGFLNAGWGPDRFNKWLAEETDRPRNPDGSLSLGGTLLPAVFWPLTVTLLGILRITAPLSYRAIRAKEESDLFMVQGMREVDAFLPHTDQITPPEYRESPLPPPDLPVPGNMVYCGEQIDGAYRTLLDRRDELCTQLKYYPVACSFAGTRRMLEKESDVDALISELDDIRKVPAGLVAGLAYRRFLAEQILRQPAQSRTRVEPLVFSAIIPPNSRGTICVRPQKNFRPICLVYKGPRKTFRLLNSMIGCHPISFFNNAPGTVSMDYFRPKGKQDDTWSRNLGDCEVCQPAMDIVLVVENIKTSPRVKPKFDAPNFEVVMYGEADVNG